MITSPSRAQSAFLPCAFSLRALPLAAALFSVSSALAATTTVTSISALQTAINSANAGDTIVLKNGTYSTSTDISIGATGTSSAPIVIRAETIGGATIGGSGSIRFVSPAAWCTVQGFILTHSNSLSIPTGTSHCRYSRNVIQLSIPAGGNVSYINISGDDAQIDYNELRNKSTLGEMLDISGSGSQVARRLWVHHNYFHDFSNANGNGAETIRWGLSGLSLSTGDGICEYNLFSNCVGENETISNKSSGNIYRFNTLINSPGGQISQRHGNFCQYYGNYIKNSSGLRIYGDNHLIHSNYLEGNDVGINIGNGDGEVEDGAALTSHDKPDNCVIVFNTLVNNDTQYEMNGRTSGLGAANTTFANNIIQGGTTAVSISSTGPYTNPVWSGNIIWNAGTIGDIPSSGYTAVDPKLATDANGVYHLQSGSPAIGTATGTYTGVTVDQDGQARPSTGKDKGADEVSTAAVTAKLLTPADVGPNAGLTSPPSTVSWEAESLTRTASGATATNDTDSSASGGVRVTLNADGIGDYVEFSLPTVVPGTYSVQLEYKTNNNRGVLSLKMDGTQVGGTLDQYASTATYPTHSFGTITFASSATHKLRLTVTGKNASSSSYTLSADKIILVAQ